jgi:hypothetical protein
MSKIKVECKISGPKQILYKLQGELEKFSLEENIDILLFPEKINMFNQSLHIQTECGLIHAMKILDNIHRKKRNY